MARIVGRPQIEGYLFDDEGDALFDLARESVGSIVELGSYKGLSTVYLAWGAKENPLRPKVFAIDHFKGEKIEGVDLYPDYRAGKYQKALLSNLASAGVVDVVKVSSGVSWSEGLAEMVRGEGPVGLIFIDADHSYEGVYKDWTVWMPKLHPRSIVAFHDRGAGGVGRLLEEIREQGIWVPHDGPGSLSIVSLALP